MMAAAFIISLGLVAVASYLLMERWERKREAREWQKYEDWCNRNKDRDA